MEPTVASGTLTEPPGHAFVLEDLPEVSDWLCGLLREQFPGTQVHAAATLAQARRKLTAMPPPGLALIDLALPDGSGIELIHALSASAPDCMIIVTTLFADDAHVFPALRAGAHGYLLKDQPPARIAAALHGAIEDGQPPLSPSIARRLLGVFNTPDPTDTAAATLTPREREILTLVAKGLRLPELVTQLGISRNTVSEHLKHIYRKLQVNTRAEAALAAARMGLVRQTF